MSEGVDSTEGENRPRTPEIRWSPLEARMRRVLESPRVRLVLPADAAAVLVDLARMVDLNRASLVAQAAALEGLIGQRPPPPVGQNPPSGRDD